MAPSHGFDLPVHEPVTLALNCVGGNVCLIDSPAKVVQPLFYKWEVGIKPLDTAQTLMIASDRNQSSLL